MKAAPKNPENIAVFSAVVTAGAMIAHHVCGAASRDALFLSVFEIEALPRMMIATAVVSVAAMFTASRAMARLGPARLVPMVFGASAILAFAEWVLSAVSMDVAAVAVYLHITVFGPIVISGFWSLINERFDPHKARHLMGRIGAGATFGGIVGGLFTGWMSFVLSVRYMLLLLMLLNTVCLGSGWVLARRPVRQRRESHPETTGALSGFRVMREVQYLRHLAALIGLVATTSALLNYVFRAEAAAAFPQGAQLLRFFAVFYMAAAVLAFLVQMTLSPVSLRKLGLAGTVAILPAVISLSVPVSFVLTALWRAVVVRGVDAVVQNSLFRSGYELFFTPVPPDRKRPTKTLIDVGFDRFGQAVASLTVMLILWIAPVGANPLLLTLAAMTAAAALPLMGRLNRGYISVLATSLHLRSLRVEEGALLDATTRRVWESSVVSHRDQHSEVTLPFPSDQGVPDSSRGTVGSVEGRPETDRPAGVASPPADRHAAGDTLLDAIADLRSGDARRVRLALAREPVIDSRLVPFVVPLLAWDDVFPKVLKVLREVMPRAPGQLLDALLDPETELPVRRRLPRVLKLCTSQRAVDGLMLGLQDKHFEVRYGCVRALMHISKRQPSLRIPREEVFKAALRELQVSKYVWATRQLLDPGDDEEALLFDDALRKRTNRSLEHVFNTLSLVLDREPLILAFRALGRNEDAVRGLALEYLDNVLPPEIRQSLRPYLGVHPNAKTSTRTRIQIIDDLRKTDESLDFFLRGPEKQPEE